MNITDKEALKIIKIIGDETLSCTIEEYPENEREERTDLEFVADEISYQISCFHEDGHVYNDDLTESRRLLRRTKYGKIRPLDPKTFKVMRGYSDTDIMIAKNCVNTYNRMVRSLKKLQEKGIYGSWWNV